MTARSSRFSGVLFSAALLVACSPSNPAGGGGDDGQGGGAAGRGGAGGGSAGRGGQGPGGSTGGPTDGPVVGSDAACSLVTCQSAGANCGPIGDGCGGMIDCGACTVPGETCGGGGAPSTCGSMPCAPRTCADAGAGCGPVGDGCGGVLDCGTCMAPQTCGGGGVPSQCGGMQAADAAVCTPRTCADMNANCGPVSDSCGNILDCGTCTVAGETCGGGGQNNRCGQAVCTPTTCAAQNANCGPVADGCGGTIDCGVCFAPDTCGGGGTPSRCGHPCVGLCPRQMACPGGGTTRLTGRVVAPTPPQFGAPDPLPNALVYIPNDTVQPFPVGVSCDRCSATASGSPLVQTVSGPDGRFTLDNVPTGRDVPLVVQLGRWRRQVTISNINPCETTDLPTELTRLPRNSSEGNIPKIAMVTGAVDALECVLRKIGIADTEFSSPQSTSARVHMYRANGASHPAGSETVDNLVNNPDRLRQYDMVIFACEGDQLAKSATARTNVVNYANAGGRVFNTHYSYTWLYHPTQYQSTPWSSVGNPWDPDPPDANGYLNHAPMNPLRSLVDTSFPKGRTFMDWLILVGASSTPTTVDIYVPRNDIDGTRAPAQRWIYSNDPPQATIQHLTFNTPFNAAADQQCGRVLFSDFHVTSSDSGAATFPVHCRNNMGQETPLTPQEKILEYMIFDLTNCVAPDNPPPCTQRTCAQANANCGPVGDGCGGIIQCGPCPAGQTCGGGGVPSQCGAPTCQPITCAQQTIACGPAGDGCGNVQQCGDCPMGQTCGGGGIPGQCGNSMSCMPLTCGQQNIGCGPAGDGCGGLLDCGPCPMGQTCGGGGVPGQCGSRPCTPRTCNQAGANCGLIGDGCGSTINCGECVPPDTCGGSGQANVCGSIG